MQFNDQDAAAMQQIKEELEKMSERIRAIASKYPLDCDDTVDALLAANSIDRAESTLVSFT